METFRTCRVPIKDRTIISLELAKCKRVPVDILKNLSEHENNEVRNEAIKNLRTKNYLEFENKKDNENEEETLIRNENADLYLRKYIKLILS